MSGNTKCFHLNKNIKNLIQFVLFTSAGALILYLVYARYNKAFQEDCMIKGIPLENCNLLDKVITDFTEAKIEWIILTILLFVISNVSRGIRWQMLLKGLGKTTKFSNAFFTIMLGYFGNLGIPRMGELIRPAAMSKYEKIPLEQVMGTVVVDRILDFISVFIVILLAFSLEFNTFQAYFADNLGDSRLANNLLLLIGVAGVLGVFLIWLFRKRLQKTAIYKRLEKIIIGFIDGLKTIATLEKPGWFIFHSIAIWVIYYLMTYLCFFSFEPTAHLAPAAGLVVFVFGALGMIFPSPGGMGTYHMMIIAGLSIYGVSGEDGFSMANIIFFSIQLFCNISLGLVALVALPIINRDYLKNESI